MLVVLGLLGGFIMIGLGSNWQLAGGVLLLVLAWFDLHCRTK